jgi:hypothetical protein
MALTVTHSTVVAVADDGTSPVGSDEWNDAHAIAGLGTGVETALGVNVGTAGSVVVNGGALGTPSSGTLTNATGLPIDGGTVNTLPVARGGTGQTTEAEAIGEMIQALSADATPDIATDYIATYDASADTGKKVLLSDIVSGAGRELLSANRTYYVDPDGDNANDGLTALTPFETIQHAVDTIAFTLDYSADYQVTIQLAAGTYSESLIVLHSASLWQDSWNNFCPRIVGNAGTREDYIIDATVICGSWRSATWWIEGVQFGGSVQCYSASFLFLQSCNFTPVIGTGSIGSGTVSVADTSYVRFGGSIRIVDTTPATDYVHFLQAQQATIGFAAVEFVWEDAIEFSESVFVLNSSSGTDFFGAASTTNPGNITGPLLHLYNASSFTSSLSAGSAANLIDGDSSYNGVLGSPTDFQTPTTGFSITLADVAFHVVLVPAGTLATGTITMPAAPFDGQIVNIRSTQIITALTVSPNSGQTVLGSPTTLAAGGIAEAIYRASNTTWYF